jgi:hypothetical protein
MPQHRERNQCINLQLRQMQPAHNHTTLEEVEEVEDKRMDMATEEAENMVDKELLI